VPSKTNLKSNTLKNFYALIKFASYRRRVQFFMLLILIVLAAASEIFSIGAVLPFLGVISDPDNVFKIPFLQPAIELMGISEPQQLLFPVTVIFCVAALGATTLRLLMLWVITRLSFAFGADISIGIYKATLYQPYEVHIARNSSEVISGMLSKCTTVIYGVVIPALTLISSLVMILAILTFLIMLDPRVAFAAFGGFGFVYSVIVYATRKRVARDSQCVADETTRVLKALQEGLGGIRDVLIDGTQSQYCDTFRASDLPLRRAQGNNLFIAQAPRYLMEGLGMLLIAIVAYVFVGSSGSFTSAIPLLGGLALGAQRALPILQLSYHSWTNIVASQFSLQDTIELLNQPMPAYALKEKSAPLLFEQHLQIKGLEFRYTQNTPYIFKNFNLVIPKGSRIGFKGTTGSGKSTLLDIIMGLLQPDKGSIIIDDTAVTSLNQQAWQSCIAHVPQFIFLADSTIEENIAFGVPSDLIDKERVRLAAKQAQISSFIEGLPNQYLTRVGEQGFLLSGGQRQRIGIARAIYKKAPVIIFDEATSALDTSTENNVMEAINNLSKDITILIVTHRPSSLEGCTQIIDLDKLRIEDRSSEHQQE
jgi:ATP-binding cassette, subfamily B, bacterial PglK